MYDVRILLWMCLTIPLSKAYYDKGRDLFVFDMDTSLDQMNIHDELFRVKRDAKETNITTKVTHLKNAFQQQLLVHWSGQGSNVMVCLAKNALPIELGGKPTPSGIYISYDYGSSFQNQTDLFKIDNATYASIDTFFSHKKERRFIMFLDKFHKVLFLSENYGKELKKVKLTFTPSDILPHPSNPYIFLIYDTEKTLHLTKDFGESFSVAQVMVKTYFFAERWPNTYGDTSSRTLLVQRIEPNSTSAIAIKDIGYENQNVLLLREKIEGFFMSGDFLFVTYHRRSNNFLELDISYKGGDFRSTVIDFEAPIIGYVVADVTDKRILLAVAHNETLTNLYVCEYKDEQRSYIFRLSLERVFSYIPNIQWKNSWLSEVTETMFADVYKVQGMKGIYLASQVKSGVKSAELNPDHLTSVISYDWGGEWNPLKAPQYDEHMTPYRCDPSTGCSLHVTQKFSLLYPVTRSLPLLSSSSAPGIILGTGTVGKSLKDRAGIFISRDAGLTWNKILRENYLFNMGNHGGIIVVVKSFRSSGETNEIFYSLDEGESWNKHIFSKTPIKVYGLMTEPGESSTVFTVFGSESTKHEWLIVNINLRNAFQRNCSALYDFKNWSPSSKTSAKLGCIMGKKDTYRRRLKHAECFINGSNDQPVSSIPCPCGAEDFECDAGFVRRKVNNTSASECIPTQKAIQDPYRIPEKCEPGKFYNRTKGYRKIGGNVCFEGYLSRIYVPDKIPCPIEEPQQFLLVAGKDKIYRVSLTDPTTEILPVKNLKNVISIDYDLKNNCVYFADIVDDVIGRQCFASGKDNIEYLVTKHLVSVEGIAFDWISNMLFIVDGKEAKIDVIRTDVRHSGRMRTTILDKKVLDKPRGIAVHPAAGYLFWTDWSKTKPAISRAHLDGSGVQLLFSSPLVIWPNGITIDHIAERIYWVDAKLDYVASSTLDGKNFIKVIEKLPLIKHPFSVAVFKDDIYWDDWSHPKILSAYKEALETTPAVKVIVNITENLMDLKVFGHGIQEGSNACSKNNSCSHLCFALPNNEAKCGCPEGLELDNKGKCLCSDGSKPGVNDTCPKNSNSSCPPQHFSCAVTNGCIPDMWRCDGEYDCEDGSDERNCEVSCPPNTFMCNASKICIPRSWACDGDNDCSDYSDEMNCSKRQCKSTEFTCKNKNCISLKWVCDGDDDCKDGSDEATCEKHIKTDTNCSENDFMCKSGAVTCVPKAWACDGEQDCLDGSDEMNCTMKKCDDFQFRCAISNRCIMKYWVCDGVMDCGLNDNSDEENCTKSSNISTTVPPIFKECRKDMFTCANSLCIPSWWKCDKVDDCGDNSDEEGCHYKNQEELPHGPIIPKRPVVCLKDQFQCEDEECIWQSWVCDGSPDCVGGEDEKNCDNHFSCPDHSFKCRTSRVCINSTNVCDGVNQCPDGSDEENCNSKTGPESSDTQCNTGFFLCDQVRCLPLSKMCDGVQNCYDDSDEKHCSESKRVYQVQQMYVDDEHRTSTSIPIQWWIKTQKNFTFQFLPSISLIDKDKPRIEPIWKNHTRWISADAFTFESLTPGELYNMTVYVKAENKIYPPSSFLTAKTLVDLPSPPWNLVVKQNSLYEFEASWNPPMHKNGEIIKYVVYVSPPLPPMETSVSATENTTSIIGYFNPGNYYTFWVLAVNELGASNSSQVVSVMSDDLANVQGINNLREDSSVKKNYTSVSLIWDKVTNATGYKIAVTPPIPYAKIPSASTPNNKYTFTNLAPGVQYLFHVNAYVKTYDGPKTPISVTTIGEELPIVPGLTVQVAKHIGTTVNLEWNLPKSASYKADWEYGIYYGVNSRELLEMPRNRTKNMSAVITNLEACSKYMFDISVVGPYGQGPLTATPVSVLTGHDIKAAPKNLWVTRGAFNTTLMLISWESSCFNMAEPIRYIISIHDQVLSQTSYITLFPSNKTQFTHSVVVEYGSKYSIWVQTETGMPTKPIEYWAPFLPVPHEVQVLFHPGSHCSVYWNTHSDLQELPKLKYEVLVSEGPSLNETTAQVYVVDKSPFNLTDMKAGVMYSFAVRTLSESGYRSLLSEVTTVPVPLGAWASVMTPTRVVSFVIPITLVLIISIAVLAVFIIRHRRLQNSFTSFANSHYSTRSGAATFTTDGFGTFDDEDSPVIRGFSDDEPLVVA